MAAPRGSDQHEHDGDGADEEVVDEPARAA
jgi:hypothetical protein